MDQIISDSVLEELWRFRVVFKSEVMERQFQAEEVTKRSRLHIIFAALLVLWAVVVMFNEFFITKEHRYPKFYIYYLLHLVTALLYLFVNWAKPGLYNISHWVFMYAYSLNVAWGIYDTDFIIIDNRKTLSYGYIYGMLLCASLEGGSFLAKSFLSVTVAFMFIASDSYVDGTLQTKNFVRLMLPLSMFILKMRHEELTKRKMFFNKCQIENWASLIHEQIPTPFIISKLNRKAGTMHFHSANLQAEKQLGIRNHETYEKFIASCYLVKSQSIPTFQVDSNANASTIFSDHKDNHNFLNNSNHSSNNNINKYLNPNTKQFQHSTDLGRRLSKYPLNGTFADNYQEDGIAVEDRNTLRFHIREKVELLIQKNDKSSVNLKHHQRIQEETKNNQMTRMRNRSRPSATVGTISNSNRINLINQNKNMQFNQQSKIVASAIDPLQSQAPISTFSKHLESQRYPTYQESLPKSSLSVGKDDQTRNRSKSMNPIREQPKSIVLHSVNPKMQGKQQNNNSHQTIQKQVHKSFEIIEAAAATHEAARNESNLDSEQQLWPNQQQQKHIQEPRRNSLEMNSANHTMEAPLISSQLPLRNPRIIEQQTLILPNSTHATRHVQSESQMPLTQAENNIRRIPSNRIENALLAPTSSLATTNKQGQLIKPIETIDDCLDMYIPQFIVPSQHLIGGIPYVNSPQSKSLLSPKNQTNSQQNRGNNNYPNLRPTVSFIHMESNGIHAAQKPMASNFSSGENLKGSNTLNNNKESTKNKSNQSKINTKKKQHRSSPQSNGEMKIDVEYIRSDRIGDPPTRHSVRYRLFETNEVYVVMIIEDESFKMKYKHEKLKNQLLTDIRWRQNTSVNHSISQINKLLEAIAQQQQQQQQQQQSSLQPLSYQQVSLSNSQSSRLVHKMTRTLASLLSLQALHRSFYIFNIFLYKRTEEIYNLTRATKQVNLNRMLSRITSSLSCEIGIANKIVFIAPISSNNPSDQQGSSTLRGLFNSTGRNRQQSIRYFMSQMDYVIGNSDPLLFNLNQQQQEQQQQQQQYQIADSPHSASPKQQDEQQQAKSGKPTKNKSNNDGEIIVYQNESLLKVLLFSFLKFLISCILTSEREAEKNQNSHSEDDDWQIEVSICAVRDSQHSTLEFSRAMHETTCVQVSARMPYIEELVILLESSDLFTLSFDLLLKDELMKSSVLRQEAWQLRTACSIIQAIGPFGKLVIERSETDSIVVSFLLYKDILVLDRELEKQKQAAAAASAAAIKEKEQRDALDRERENEHFENNNISSKKKGSQINGIPKKYISLKKKNTTCHSDQEMLILKEDSNNNHGSIGKSTKEFIAIHSCKPVSPQNMLSKYTLKNSTDSV